MELIIQPDAASVANFAARLYRRQLREQPATVLGLATGSTPLGLYRELIALHCAGEIDFSRASSFNLDEYLGLGPEHPQSYAFFMREHLFQHVNLPPERIHIPDGLADDCDREAADYEASIRLAGGIDLQLLGVGANGHIGFNEPSSSLASRTRIKTLAPQTISDNARFFGDPASVPRHVITMGIGTIMEARRTLVLAMGPAKAEAVAAMAEGPITASCPASILQMHPRCTLVIDEAAAARLERSDYYRWVHENKPTWQQV
jgi:glucosamine-6-phosphate deaminase